MTGWWQRWRRARALERRAIPDALWQLTLVRFPFLAARSAAQVAALREMATLFLAEKEFSGARGLVVSDEMAVAIAAQADPQVVVRIVGDSRQRTGWIRQP